MCITHNYTHNIWKKEYENELCCLLHKCPLLSAKEIASMLETQYPYKSSPPLWTTKGGLMNLF